MKKLSVSIIALAIIAFSNGAFAGFKLDVPVSVTANTFSGAWGSARDGAGGQYIGCRDDGGSAFCLARDAAGTTRSCTTNDPVHLSIIRGLTDTSRLIVNFGGGMCTRVTGINASYYYPKEP